MQFLLHKFTLTYHLGCLLIKNLILTSEDFSANVYLVLASVITLSWLNKQLLQHVSLSVVLSEKLHTQKEKITMQVLSKIFQVTA